MTNQTFRKEARSRMSIHLLQTAGWSAMLLALSTPAWAQDQLHAPPPDHFTLDERGVDLISGTFNLSSTDVVIGQLGAGGMAYSRAYVGPGWRDSITGTIADNGGVVQVSLGGGSERFTLSGGVYTPTNNVGSTLAPNSLGGLTYTTADGVAYVFHAPTGDYMSPTDANSGRLDSIIHPSGETLTYHYVMVIVNTGNPNDPRVPAIRVQSVSSNFGYRLHLQYANNNPSSLSTLPSFYRITKVTGFNTSVDSCSPTAFSCTFSRTWPSATYGVTGSTQTVTDQSGRTTTYTFSGNRVALIQAPGAAAPTLTVGYDGSGRVSSVSDGSSSWGYAYSGSGSTRITTVSDPLSNQSVATSNLSTNRLTSWRDPLLRTTSYLYDSQGRTTRVTRPEGDYVAYSYDTRGNIIETRAVAKPGSGLADVYVSSSFPAICADPATCNLPTTTTDARGGVTDYTYGTHGQVTSITQPEPTPGAARPQTRIAYTATPSGPLLPTEVSSCATLASCIGTADEIRTTLTYGPLATTKHLLPATVVQASGNGSLSATTAMTYTPDGDLASVDGPLSGAADTTTYRYDNARQLIGVISPDPDGSGPLMRRAVRNTYNLRGQVTLSEQGTVTGLMDSDWTAFISLQQQAVTYDAQGRPTHQRAQAGSTTYSLTQASYDAVGRTDCVATRMNPWSFASPPNSACTSADDGNFGPDRITRYGYNAVGQLISLTSGYGSNSPITERATYTSNGQPMTLIDGRGNTSTFEYDGHSRLKKLRYPNSSSSGSSTSDYDEYDYDAASNVISTRTRSGQIFGATYDALNRQTALNAPAGTPSTTYTYDNLDRLVSASIPGQSITRAWDALNRLSSETGPLGTMSYQYDLSGQRTRQTWPDGFYVTNTWNLAGEMTATLHNGTTEIVGYHYDNLGRRNAITRSNGVTSTYVYDGISRLALLSHDVAGTVADVVFGYAHNPAGQIVSKTVSNNAYVYGPTAGTATYANNGRNQVTSVGGVNINYDANGNITNDATRAFTYDAASRMTGANGGTSTLSYDALGRLDIYVGTNGGRFIYSGAETVGFAPVGSTILQNRFIRGPGVDEIIANYTTNSAPAQYWAYDERGSLINLSDGTNGANTVINTYDEYGVPAPTNLGRLQYTGQLWMPDIGAYHYKARAYQPMLGRFLQTDPIGYGDGANLYVYVGGDPVNKTDFGGLQSTRLPDLPGVPRPPQLDPCSRPGITCLTDRSDIERFLSQPVQLTDIIARAHRRRQNRNYGENIIEEIYRPCPAQIRVSKSYAVRSRLNDAWTTSRVQLSTPPNRREVGFYAYERHDGSVFTIGDYRGNLDSVWMPPPPLSGNYRSITYFHTHPNSLPMRDHRLSDEDILNSQHHGVAIGAVSTEGMHFYCGN